MPINDLSGKQTITRQATLIVPEAAILIHLSSISEPANSWETFIAQTGQEFSSGRVMASDVTATIPASDQVARLAVEEWSSRCRNGFGRKAGTLIYYAEDGTPGMTLGIGEILCKPTSFPATSVGGAGSEALLTFTMSLRNIRSVPGT